MYEEKPNYYSVIPAEVRYDANLKANEKLMYGEITALTFRTGECWASNNYFANLYNTTPQAISKWILNLEKKGYLSIEYERDGKAFKKRIIRVSTNIDRGINKCFKGYQQMIEENNINNNNNILCGSYQETINNIIDYMNNVADEKYFKIKKYFKFKPTSNATIKIIKARLNEGWTKEDLYDVIYLAYYKFVEHEFKGNNNNSSINYFNPSTIFTSEKVQKYKNEYENLC